jgi:hypothetical protein
MAVTAPIFTKLAITQRILWISAVSIFTRVDPEVWKTEWKFIYAAAESKTKPNCTEI